jgi:hypothetical protein
MSLSVARRPVLGGLRDTNHAGCHDIRRCIRTINRGFELQNHFNSFISVMSVLRKRLAGVFGNQTVAGDSFPPSASGKASQGQLRNGNSETKGNTESLFATAIQHVLGAAEPFGSTVSLIVIQYPFQIWAT